MGGTSNGVELGASAGGCNIDTSQRPWVDVYDRHSTQNVSCTLFHLDGSSVVIASFTASSSGSGNAAQRLFFAAEGEIVHPGDRLVATCSVPPITSDMSYVSNFGVPACEYF
jgi:hypothetical protein